MKIFHPAFPSPMSARDVRHARRIVLQVETGIVESWFLGVYRKLEKLAISLE